MNRICIWLLAAASAVCLCMLPRTGTDAAKLLPAQVLVIGAGDGAITVEADNGAAGSGPTLAAALAGAAVSFSGLLGFIGLIVPHIMRRLTGGDAGPLLASCALGGAALLCFCDTAARLLFAPYELPVGIVLSLAGGPFFIVLLLRQRRGRIHA